MDVDYEGDTEEFFPSEDNEFNGESLVVNTSAGVNNEVSNSLQISDGDDLASIEPNDYQTEGPCSTTTHSPRPPLVRR